MRRSPTGVSTATQYGGSRQPLFSLLPRGYPRPPSCRPAFWLLIGRVGPLHAGFFLSVALSRGCLSKQLRRAAHDPFSVSASDPEEALLLQQSDTLNGRRSRHAKNNLAANLPRKEISADPWNVSACVAFT